MKVIDRETDIYLRLLENAGQLKTMLEDFGKDYKMSAKDFINLTQDSGMAQAIRNAFDLTGKAFTTGSGLLAQY